MQRRNIQGDGKNSLNGALSAKRYSKHFTYLRTPCQAGTISVPLCGPGNGDTGTQRTLLRPHFGRSRPQKRTMPSSLSLGSRAFPLTLGDCPCSSPGHKLVGRPLGPVLGVHHEEHVRETSAEVRAVRVVVPRGLGCVHVHALGAVELHHGLPWDVRKAWETVRLSVQAPLTVPKLPPKQAPTR